MTVLGTTFEFFPTRKQQRFLYMHWKFLQYSSRGFAARQGPRALCKVKNFPKTVRANYFPIQTNKSSKCWNRTFFLDELL